jgi:hypothetical protein
MWKILSLTRIADQAQVEDSHLGEREEEEDPQDSRITTQETRTSIVSIMEEDTAPKDAQKLRRTSQELSKKKAMMSIASSMMNQIRSNFWQPQFMNSQPSPVAMQQFQ